MVNGTDVFNTRFPWHGHKVPDWTVYVNRKELTPSMTPSTAIQRGFGILTFNAKDFQDVPGLKLTVIPSA